MVTKLVLENLKHRPIRTLLTVLAIGLQVTLVLTIVGLSRGLIEASKVRTRGVGADILIRPPGASIIGMSGAAIPEGVVALVEKQPHVTVAQGILVHPIGGLESITGIDIQKFDKMSGGLDYRDGGPFEGPNDILVDENFADERKLRVGVNVKLANHDWRVRGIVGPGKLSKVFAQKPILQDLTSNTGKVSMLYVKVDTPASVRPSIEHLKKLLEGYQVYSMDEFLSLITPSAFPGLNAFIATIVGLAIVFGFLVVFLAMYTAVLERTREIGILKALGATPGYIIGMLLRETVLLAIIGSVIGIALSYVAKWVLTALVPSSLAVVAVPDWWLRAALISLAGSVFGALYPGTKAARQDTIEALAYE
ncbi:MAG TPA: ABC transporter permease [Bryobacteraceae bacterium]|nr:ABC transporter permease [Bryobacteraceae bacterium]